MVLGSALAPRHRDLMRGRLAFDRRHRACHRPVFETESVTPSVAGETPSRANRPCAPVIVKRPADGPSTTSTRASRIGRCNGSRTSPVRLKSSAGDDEPAADGPVGADEPPHPTVKATVNVIACSIPGCVFTLVGQSSMPRRDKEEDVRRRVLTDQAPSTDSGIGLQRSYFLQRLRRRDLVPHA